MIATLIILSVSLILFLDYIRKKRRNDISANIPGPTQIPIFGNYFMFGMRSAKDAARIMKEHSEIYNGFSRSWFFNELNMMATNPEDIEILMSSTKHSKKSTIYKTLHSWLGQGLLVSEGSKWHSRRKIITPAFHFKVLEQFIDIFDQQSDILVKQLNKHSNSGKAFNVYPYITLAALDVISETAMGVKINAQTDSNNTYVKAVAIMTEIVMHRISNNILQNDLIFKIFAYSEKQRHDEALKELHEFTERVIKQRRNHLRENTVVTKEAENDIGLKKKMAFLDILLQSTINGQPLSNADIREEVDTFMFEGHDTTTSGICYALYLLSRHPDVQNRLFEEIRQVIGNDKDRPVTYTDLQEMKYMEWVIKESMRLYPPVPIIGREFTEDTKINNYRIPRGTVITIPIFVMMKNPKYFPDPERFNPDRHSLENSTEKTNPYAYIPFSAGSRNCIGQKFAMLEMKSAISKVLRNFELLPMGVTPDPIINLVTKSTNGVHIGIKDRIY